MAKKTESTPVRKGSRPLDQTSKQPGKSRRWIWVAAGVGIALVVVLAIVGVMHSRRTAAQAQPVAATSSDGLPVDRRIIGDPNAPVLIEAYEDYQCPHCQEFTAALDKTIRQDLVASGIARFQYQNRFVIDQYSIVIASAAECAADQGRFWDYHDQLFANLSRSPGASRSADLKRYAANAGLNTSQFNQCLDTQKHYEQMLREDEAAKTRNVNATPTIFLNGVQYSGTWEPAAFKQAVEDAAKAAKVGATGATPEAAK